MSLHTSTKRRGDVNIFGIFVETGLAMLFHAHVPASYWVDAFSSATYIINRLPTKLLDDNPPTDSDDVSSHGAPPAPPATAPTEPSSVHQMKTRSKSGIFKTKHSPDFVSLTSHAYRALFFPLYVLTRAALLDSKPVSTPLAANEVFVTGGSLFANPTLYRSLVGALQYLTITT
ncbi:hypothetical protein Tco_1104728 [Tanacetum coccineum]